MVLSVVVALTLTPMLCSKILKPIDHEEHAAKGGFFGWFNRGFQSFTDAVTGFVGHSLNAKLIMGPPTSRGRRHGARLCEVAHGLHAE